MTINVVCFFSTLQYLLVMPDATENPLSSHQRLSKAIQLESQKFQECYLWLEQNMPEPFFQDVSADKILLITHNLMSLPLQENFAAIHLKHAALVLCLESPEADIQILRNYTHYGIKSYRTYISKAPPPFPDIHQKLRIAVLYFTEMVETIEKAYPAEAQEELRKLVRERYPDLKDEDFYKLISGMNTRFLMSMPSERLVLALDLYFKARKTDNCQYRIFHDSEGMQIILAWADISKSTFLYRVANLVYRHGLVIQGVNASFIHPYSKDSALMMLLRLHSQNGKDPREVTNIPEFLNELFSIKYFPGFDAIEHQLVNTGIISGVMGNLLRAMVDFIHQMLATLDPYMFAIGHIERDLCRHPDLTARICQVFAYRFSPEEVQPSLFESESKRLLEDIESLDTGQEEIDLRCKNVLRMAVLMVTYTLKTNFYRANEISLSFRLDPTYLDHLPFKRKEKFPELPYAIFFIKGLDFFGFQIRFQDLARGGFRTVFPEPTEKLAMERKYIFTECYNLALTQQKKNKDIPEGGAKAILFLNPYQRLDSNLAIIKRELEISNIDEKEIQARLSKIYQELKKEYLFQAQRAFISGLVVLCNCDPDGSLRPHHIVDYWKKPEYLYLGPDENMFPEMIDWIAAYSVYYNYKPGSSFISGHLTHGFNHKQYGVTSLGVTVCMEEVLKEIGKDPYKDAFTVKMAGGPDGDVAGNQILNLYRYYPNTAKLIALTDISGTIYDPRGLDLSLTSQLFYEGKPIKFYPPEKLSEGGFLIDKNMRRNPTSLVQQTLRLKKDRGRVVEEWLSSSEVNHLLRNFMHKTMADVFVPGGGRPRTLNETNYKDFLNEEGKPTAKTIAEGANIYLSQQARRHLEELGVLIIKDSSSNKGGVICSSYEVLCMLALGLPNFLKYKDQLILEVQDRIRECSLHEVRLLLNTHRETGEFLTDLSEQVSERINLYTHQILDHLEPMRLSFDPTDPFIACFLSYCLPTLRKHFKEFLLHEIPENHKKAIIACHIACHVVYTRGLDWSPSIVESLPSILSTLK